MKIHCQEIQGILKDLKDRKILWQETQGIESDHGKWPSLGFCQSNINEISRL